MNDKLVIQLGALSALTINTYIEKDKLYKGSFETSLNNWGDIAYFQRVTDLIAKYNTQQERGMASQTTLVNIFNYTAIYIMHRRQQDFPLTVLEEEVKSECALKSVEGYMEDTTYDGLVGLFNELAVDYEKVPMTCLIEFLQRLAAYWCMQSELELSPALATPVKKGLLMGACTLQDYIKDNTTAIQIPCELQGDVFEASCHRELTMLLKRPLGHLALTKVLKGILYDRDVARHNLYTMSHMALEEHSGSILFQEFIHSLQDTLHTTSNQVTKDEVEAITKLVSFLNHMRLFDQSTLEGFIRLLERETLELIEANKALLERIVYVVPQQSL